MQIDVSGIVPIGHGVSTAEYDVADKEVVVVVIVGGTDLFGNGIVVDSSTSDAGIVVDEYISFGEIFGSEVAEILFVAVKNVFVGKEGTLSDTFYAESTA